MRDMSPKSKVQSPRSLGSLTLDLGHWTLDFLTSDLVHRASWTMEIGRVDAVARLFGGDAVADELSQIVIATAAAEHRASVPFHGGKQTIADLSFGRQSHSVA